MADHKQVFLTQSPTRWQRFKWAFRIVSFIIILLLIILGVAVMKELFTPKLPLLKKENGQYVALLNNGKRAAIESINKKYDGFGKYISGKSGQLKHIRYVSKADSLHA